MLFVQPRVRALDYVREVFPRSGEPPVAEDEDDEREACEVSQPAPVGCCAFEHDVAVASNQRRKRIEVDEGSESFGHD